MDKDKMPDKKILRKMLTTKILTHKFKKDIGIITEKFVNELNTTFEKYISELNSKRQQYISIDEIDELEPYMLNALRAGGINSLEKLTCQTEEGLKSLRGIGSKAVEHIKQALAGYDLTLSERYK
jgi:DNA-directed RNA polymerase alpha subunit